ncbi:DUF4837 family protein [Reichenbachiella versicolor]|uniref:DUF4837 family protein n=1 Tax=Reichenbachiella versicolor TaxID=1821036 RepID=UPI000D6DC8F2|nr:DUF4837 family protein [Reichenbachiella versicolor]
MLKKITVHTLVCLSLLITAACGDQSKSSNSSSSNEKSYLPKAAGEANAILVVMDTTQWNGPVGDAIRDIYSEYVPGLPQDEPYFKVRNVNPLKFANVLKTATNIIMVSTLDRKGRMARKMREFFTDESLKAIQKDSSLFLMKKQNVYANGQEMLHLFGQNDEQLINHLKQNKAKLRGHYIEVERKRLESSLFKVREKGIEKKMEENGFRMSIPYGYDLAKALPDFYWVRQLDAEYEKNIIIHYKTYDSMDPFEDVMAFREEITSAYMRDVQKPEIYMTTQPYKASIKEISFHGKYAKECRALWKLSDISAGGPFVSYVFVDESQRRLYYIEGYVYSPGEDKRLPMQEMELILQSFKSGDELKTNS